MDNERFMIEVEKSHLRSKQLLLKKGKEYTPDNEGRLSQFYRAGSAQNITPHSALVGMVTKHFTAVADMAKHPWDFSIEKWNKKVTDVRNYTYLLDALLRDKEEGEVE